MTHYNTHTATGAILLQYPSYFTIAQYCYAVVNYLLYFATITREESMSDSALLAQQQRAHIAWQAFIKGDTVPTSLVPDYILKGWELSKKREIDPLKPQIPPVLAKKELDKLRKDHKALLTSAEPVLRMLEVSIRNTGYIATLAVASGYLLEVVGDSSFLTKAETVMNIPGALRSVEAVGSSSLSLAMIEKKTLEIVGYEHYSSIFHEWKCAASPIFNEHGEAIASLAISGHINRKDHHTLALVKSCADIITIRLRESTLLLTQQRLNSMLHSLYNSLPEAVLAISENAIITHANHNALRFIGGENEELEGKPIDAVISADDAPRVRAILQQAKPKTCELAILTPEGEQNKTCRFVPIHLDNGTPSGMTLTIVTKTQILDMVRHVSGNYAKYSFGDIKGKSAPLLVQIDLAKRAAATNSRVLLTGESGTGKELFAQSIHNSSPVSNGPFVAISCAAIPRDLIESELFGYVGGTFTGAREKGMIGKVELASGGTLFLDEINSLPLEMQAKLLRVLQQREIVRIGDTKPTPVDARIIAATNVNLMDAIKQGSFREDLYYRLNVVEVIIPPLRDRKEDIELLMHLILQRQSLETHLPFPQIAPEVLDVLLAYAWPGNVRELDNICERALLLSGGLTITLEHLPKHIAETAKSYSGQRSVITNASNMEQVYKQLIINTLAQCQGNISLAAEKLGVARSTLYRNMRKHRITAHTQE